jgi:ubiquinone/menaquinone biosynthesis C-methylase UbiE
VNLRYDTVAHAYDRRYALHDYPGIRAAVLATADAAPGNRVLELGCGTGKWLAVLGTTGREVTGIDASTEMLEHARAAVQGDLRHGVAEALPWPDGAFDAVFCINALHHFRDPPRALAEAFRVLGPGGSFLTIGLDPHERRDRWFVYDLFPETVDLDLARFASASRRRDWLEAAGFEDVAVEVAEHLRSTHTVDEALAAGVLQPTFTSQLSVLTPAQYEAGMQRLQEAARDAGSRLETDLMLFATRGRKGRARG